MKPQSAQRKTLCSQKEFSFKDKTEQVISCATKVSQCCGSNTYTIGTLMINPGKGNGKRVGLLINCSVEKIKTGKSDHYCKRTQRGGRVKGFNSLIVIFFSVFSVVRF